ncbi:hypothetical protein ACFYWS_20540 [Streptomyces sp. NPDC002795]|uniref:hypothetical protein n=1 Tax=Streptomyces sp. NPDC002795 TaxID=3364665 RepID=UPI0036AA6D9F
MDDQLRRVRIAAQPLGATITLGDHDISGLVSGYQLTQSAKQPAELVLQLAQSARIEFDGLARVAVGVAPDPGPAAAAFLSAIDAGELERSALARHDLLDGGAHEFTRAMLKLLVEWASGLYDGDSRIKELT